jgi:hypothetical protein
MADNEKQRRVLALDLRASKFGFVVFEGPVKLLDFGVRSYARHYGPLGATARRKFAALVDLYFPSVVVLGFVSGRSDDRNARVNAVQKTLRQDAKRRSVPIRCLSRKKVRRFFQAQGLTTKYHIAAHLAERFPDLAWELAPKRRPWEAEPYQMPVFDAAAVGVAYYDRLGQDKGSK